MSYAVNKFISNKSFLDSHIERIEIHCKKLSEKLHELKQSGKQFDTGYYNLKNRLHNSQEVLKQLKEQK
jgi:predicted outer membrane protein